MVISSGEENRFLQIALTHVFVISQKHTSAAVNADATSEIFEDIIFMPWYSTPFSYFQCNIPKNIFLTE